GAPELLRRLVLGFRGGGAVRGGEVEVARRVSWPYVQVRVRYFKPLDHQTNPRGAESVANAVSDQSGDVKQVAAQISIQVHPMVHFGAGNHQRVPRSKRLDGEKSHAGLVGPNESARNFSRNDAAEDGSHDVDSSSR